MSRLSVRRCSHASGTPQTHDNAWDLRLWVRSVAGAQMTGHLPITAHRNRTVVRLGGGFGSAENEVANGGVGRPTPPPRIWAENSADTTRRWSGRPTRPAEPPARSDTPPIPCASCKSKTPVGGQFAQSCPHRTSPLPYAPPPPPPSAARLACGPINNMTRAVAIDRLVCAPPCVSRKTHRSRTHALPAPVRHLSQIQPLRWCQDLESTTRKWEPGVLWHRAPTLLHGTP